MAGDTNLDVWHVAHRLARAVADTSRRFPPHERFELTSQLRWAALSVPTNLAQGCGSFGAPDYLRHVRNAAGSLAEVDYLLFFARESGYLTDTEFNNLRALRREATLLVHRLARSLEAALH